MLASSARQALKATAAGLDLVRAVPVGLTVLIYHRVGRRTHIEVDLDTGAFREQMQFLAAHAMVVTLSDGLDRLADASAARVPMVAVTFDDGTADFAEEAVPILAEFGVPVTLYLSTYFVEQRQPFPDHGTPLSWAALQNALTTGLVTVGSHTHTHALLDRLPPDRIGDELDRSVALISDRLGIGVEHFAYPKAVRGSQAAEAAVATRFRTAALAGTRVNIYGGTDPYRVARSPIQVSDGMRWFKRKAAGGMGLEDAVRDLVNRSRYKRAER
jgi:peptidoglycan/xylan/chitin deacetylase (PgdA/CDA1 family)